MAAVDPFWLFDAEGFVPRACCGRWNDWLIWLAVLSDIAIAAAYYAIPVALLVLWKRKAMHAAKSKMLVWFALFIFACGTTHAMDATMFFWPAYRLSTMTLFFTAAVSVPTACMLPWAIREAMKLPSSAEYEAAIENVRRKEEEESRKNQILAQEVESLREQLDSIKYRRVTDESLETMRNALERISNVAATPAS